MKMHLRSIYHQISNIQKYTKSAYSSSGTLFKRSNKPTEIALLMGYNGYEYSGFQRNRDVKTIEEEFLLALLKSNLISQEQYKIPKWVLKFQQSSRTDRSVSAIHQVISIKLPLIDNLIEKINSELPPTIRVFGYRKVINNFNCRKFATSRTYSYMIPTFAFCPIEEITTENFRAPDSLTIRLNQVLQEFVGTHPYHNFSSGRSPDEQESKRVIWSIMCSKPFFREGLQFYIITVTGQSFIYHQIRKMIGLVIALIRGLIPEDAIRRAWESPRRDIPLAPGLGLILVKINHDTYNRLCSRKGYWEPLYWDEHKDDLAKFTDNLLSYIAKKEKQEKIMMKWLPNLLYCAYEPRPLEIPKEAPIMRSPLGKIAFCLDCLQKESKVS